MLNIIKSDIYRITKSLAIYIAFALTLLMIGLSVYMVEPGSIGTNFTFSDNAEYTNKNEEDALQKYVDGEIKMSEMRDILLTDENYELDRSIIGCNFNLYYVFIFVASLAVTVDFSSGAVKNTLSSAISRRRYFISKTAFVMASCTFIFLLNNYLAYLINMIFNKGKVSASLMTITILSIRQLPVILAALLAGISFIFKKNSLFNTISISIGMLYPLLLGLIIKLLSIKDAMSVYRFEFGFILSKLSGNPASSDYISGYAFSAAVAIVFLTLGWISFRKVEIK